MLHIHQRSLTTCKASCSTPHNKLTGTVALIFQIRRVGLKEADAFMQGFTGNMKHVEMVSHLSKGPAIVRTAPEYHAVSSGRWEEAEGVLGLPWWFSGKESACNAGDPGLIPELGRFPGEGYGHPLQHSCLENSMDREAWQATVHRVTQSQTRVKQLGSRRRCVTERREVS